VRTFRQPQQQRRPKKNLMIVGPAAVSAAIAEGKQFDRIYMQGHFRNTEIDKVQTEARQAGIPINFVPVEKLNGFNVPDHNGCIAVLSPIPYQNLQDVILQITDKGETPLFLILDGITDVRNIGAMVRTAFCCGVHALIIPDKGVGALNEDAMLTSAGALEKLPVCRVNSLMKAVDDLHLNGIKVFASEMNAEARVDKLPLNEPAAIIMGSEDKGIFPALAKICDERFAIPMKGDFESLNVSVAAGMILYEAMMQRLRS
jgi:23S rRNA (guanosine2251-2'-O)-methyltransferase